MKPTVACVALGLPLPEPLDYIIPEHLQKRVAVGQRVWVPFRGRKKSGYVTTLLSQSRLTRLKPIQSIIDREPLLTPAMLDLAQYMVDVYGCSLGEAIDVMLPKSLRQGKGLADRPVAWQRPSAKTVQQGLMIGDDFDQACETMARMAKPMMKQGQAVVIIVPETRLVPQVASRLEEALSLHVCRMMRQTEKDELALWQRVVAGDVQVVVGTRSHVFLPVKYLGLMIIFHEENDAFKEEQMPCYHARHIACWRSQREGFRLAFVSLTPSVELWHRAYKNDWRVKMAEPQDRCNKLFIDMTNYDPQKSSIISESLHVYIEKAIRQQQPIMLLVQRLGLLDKVVKRVRYLFPDAVLAQYTQQTKRFPKQFDILVATPAVLREAYQHQIEHIAFCDADAEFHRMDDEAVHHLFSMMRLLGLMAKEGLVIQTRQKEHYVMQAVKKNDAGFFYDQDLAMRCDLGLPPFRAAMRLTLRCADQDVVEEQGESLLWALSDNLPDGIDAFGPPSDNIIEAHGKFRYPITLLGENLSVLHHIVRDQFLRWKKKRSVQVNIDVRGI